MLRHSGDDFPVRICESQREAIQVANSIGWDVPPEVSKALSVDASTPCSICIYQFKEGRVVGARLIRSYDDEQDDDDDAPVDVGPDLTPTHV